MWDLFGQSQKRSRDYFLYLLKNKYHHKIVLVYIFDLIKQDKNKQSSCISYFIENLLLFLIARYRFLLIKNTNLKINFRVSFLEDYLRIFIEYP